MKIAIMQPYIFPYIGYFQLVSAVDNFVFYDDVNYIKGGWINRNKILVNNEANLFTISLDKPSSFTLISETLIEINKFKIFRVKFIKSIQQSYKKAPFYEIVFPLLETFLLAKSPLFISRMAIDSVVMVSKYLGLNTNFQISSVHHPDSKALDKVARLIAISKNEGATQYINPIGGVDLYNREEFYKNKIELRFIKSGDIAYKQFNNAFVPWLSIIDVLMFNSKEEVRELLNNFSLVD